MTRSVDEINLTNFRLTGTSISIQRRAIDVEVKWTDNAGVKQTMTRTLTFPDFLTNRTNNWIRGKLTQLMIDAVRVELGIEAEEDQL